MRKYVLIPDSFKGTLSSREVCQIVAEAIRSQEPEAEICAIPVADGGEGTVDAFLSAVGGQQVPVACTGAIRRSHHRLLRPAAGTAPPWWEMAAGGGTAHGGREPRPGKDHHLWRGPADPPRRPSPGRNGWYWRWAAAPPMTAAAARLPPWA